MSSLASAAPPAPRARGGSATVGMVGAGQLARMTHQASIGLDVALRVLAQTPEDPAVLAGARHILGNPDDLGALLALARECDVLTFDHERTPQEHLRTLEREGARLEPSAAAALCGQDKLHARERLSSLGFPVPAFATARTETDVAAFAREHGWPLVAKAIVGGYDGRGVWTLRDASDAAALLRELPSGVLIEPLLQFDCELAVLVARSRSGQTACYPVAETVQRDAMCREVVAPAAVDPALASQATELARAIVTQLHATGIVAVELFSTPSGLVVNELALRPHNSGHYTIEGCATSQFEQHLRAVLDLPLGLPTLLWPVVTTVNVLGSRNAPSGDSLQSALGVPGAHVHLYGKRSRPGRKLGHVTVCGQDREPTRAAAQLAAGLLEGRT